MGSPRLEGGGFGVPKAGVGLGQGGAEPLPPGPARAQGAGGPHAQPGVAAGHCSGSSCRNGRGNAGPASSREPGAPAQPQPHASARGARASASARAAGETEAQPGSGTSLRAAGPRLADAASRRTGAVRQAALRQADEAKPRQMEGTPRADRISALPAPPPAAAHPPPGPRRAAAGEGFNCSSSRA